MSFHVGIDPEYGSISVYNKIFKETFRLEITTKLIRESKDVDVKKMFKEIRVRNKPTTLSVSTDSCRACIYIHEYHGSEIRKSLIEKGKKFGFLNVQIINWDISLYLDFISQIKQIPKNGDIIWIFYFGNIYIWKKVNFKAKLLKRIGCETKEKFFEIMHIEKNDYGNKINPDIFIYTMCDTLDLNLIKTLYPKCQCFEVTPSNDYSKIALIKARIMAKDKELLDFDVDAQLFEDIDVKINEKIVMSIKMCESLPFLKTMTIYSSEMFFKIFVGGLFKEEFQVIPPNESFQPNEIVVKIDSNRIITIEIISGSYVIPKKINATENINVVGIDLGISRCFAAVDRRNGIETIALDNTGERHLPSFVSFYEENELCGQIVVNRLQQNSKSTVFDSKRIIGRNFNEVKIDSNWPFAVLESKDKPTIIVQSQNGPISFSPEEISAVLLKQIKKKAEEIQGKELNQVVITVPASFSTHQKQATKDAAIQAGWNVVYLFPEPIAAAFAYFVDRPIPNEFTILLFDFGGGTLDVCVIKVVNENLNIIATGGDANLGGRDFDNILFNHFSQILEDRYTIKVNSKEKLKYLLLQKCMEIKHNLSVRKEDILDVSDFDTHLEGTVTIATHELETMSTKLLEKTQNVIIGTLSTTEYTSKDIHKVLLVGGSSRMPMVRELLRKMFTKAEHCCEENPDEVVAIGAANYAYHIAKNLK